MMSFSENLREAISIKNLTTKELAARTGILEGTISSYLKTKGPMPPVDKALKLSQALDVSVAFLVTGFEDTSPACTAGPQLKLRKYARIIECLDSLPEKQLNLVENIVAAVRASL